MKNPLLVVSLVILLCFAFACQQGKEVKKEVAVDIGAAAEEIRHLIKEWVEASNAGDIDKIMSLVTDDCVMIPPNAPPLIGKDAIRKDYQESFDLYSSQGDETIAEFRVSGDFAFSRGTWTHSQTPKAGGESKKTNGSFLDIYQKQPDGSWKLFWNAWSDESLISPPPPEKE